MKSPRARVGVSTTDSHISLIVQISVLVPQTFDNLELKPKKI